MIKYFIKFFQPILLASIVASCAQISAPSGGKKDTTPPSIISSLPSNGSPGFTGNKFELKFSEFVVLKEINKRLLISPPVKETPDFHLKGKSLIVKFKDELKPNTTYSVYFGDAIQDLTEGNPIHNFTYIFSTGDHVDSLSLTGQVVEAFDLQPVEGAMVMLYNDINDTIPLDSLPMTVPPYYLSKTGKEGNFQFNGLADQSYLIFALMDQNSNYIFDQPNEEIAFVDSLIKPFYKTPVKVDTTTNPDSLSIEIDTIINNVANNKADTLEKKETNINSINMFMFNQSDTIQRLMEAKLIKLNTIRFIFSNPAKNVSINAENYPQRNLWHLTKWSSEQDTLWWFLNESGLTVDTLNVLLTKYGDTIDNVYISTKLRDKAARNLGRKDKNPEKVKKNILNFSTNMKTGIKPTSILKLKFDQPIETIITDSILFIAGDDSSYAPSFRALDSLHLNYLFPITLQEDTKYRLDIPDSCFIDWNGYFNKKKTIGFSTKAVADYGTLTVNLQPEENGNYIFQLLDTKEKIVKQISFTNDTSLLMEYLNPAKYVLKIIIDKNGNGKWDAGNYNDKIEPGVVTYYGKIINIRANWELEETWKFDSYNRNGSPQKKKK